MKYKHKLLPKWTIQRVTVSDGDYFVAVNLEKGELGFMYRDYDSALNDIPEAERDFYK